MIFEPQLLLVSTSLAELDCVLAFAEAAVVYNWHKPVVVEDSVCEIKEGRHPLVELCNSSFVTNDTVLRAGQGILPVQTEEEELNNSGNGVAELNASSMIVLTGANFSGKSVYLKQTALIVYMAHLGCFVPARCAIIGLTDRILTRISTRESISEGSSAFMIDLQQLSFALRNSTRRSLIILDEFGKGTGASDGAGLLLGTLKHLVLRGIDMPKVVVATHFQTVFNPRNCLIGDDELTRVEFAYMEILLAGELGGGADRDAGARTRPDLMTYLYKLRPGLCMSSHAASCAALFGIDPAIVARACRVTEAVRTFELEALLREDLTEKEKEELRECEQVGRRFVEWDLPDVEDEVEGTKELMDKLKEVLGEGDGMEVL